MTVSARYGEINMGDLVWYWCFRDSKRKPGIVLNHEVADESAQSFVLVQTLPPNYSQWFKSHSLFTTKEQVKKETEEDQAKKSRRDLHWTLTRDEA